MPASRHDSDDTYFNFPVIFSNNFKRFNARNDNDYQPIKDSLENGNKLF